MEHIRRAGVLSIVPENAEIIVRADGVQQLAAVLQHVATSKAFAKQVGGWAGCRCVFVWLWRRMGWSWRLMFSLPACSVHLSEALSFCCRAFVWDFVTFLSATPVS
jgi:hypothetical protein